MLAFLRVLCEVKHRMSCRSFTTTVSQRKICNFSGETLKVLEFYNFL